MEIKRITIVTQQGVQTYIASKTTVIKEGTYRIAGDPYECFHVVCKDKIIAEIRCNHNLEIAYY